MSRYDESPEQKNRKRIGAESAAELRREALRTQNEAAKASAPEDVQMRCRVGALLLNLAARLERGEFNDE